MAKQPDVAALQAALSRTGYQVDVEAVDRLAVIRSPDDDRLLLFTHDVRAQLMNEARTHGFTHVAIELVGARLTVSP
jgi:hypothetical protein